ncbi:MAG: hypothetical protein E7120_00030 [Bacteroidales bacterium]|nr:hypothetical protein [Bacteroidales bacterium]
MRLIGRSLCTIMIAVSFFVLSGCKALDTEFAYQLTLSESSIVFDMHGAEKSLSVAPFPEKEKWTAAYAEEEDWFTFEAVSDALLVAVDPNYSTESRSGAIILSSPENHFEPYRVEVVQEGAEPLEFTTTVKDHEFDSEGGEICFTVTSNYDWTVGYDADWLTVVHEVPSDRMIVLCQPNASEEQRSAILTMYIGEGEQMQVRDIVISQGTRAENPYFQLLGKWEITAAKWYYSPNGSLNSLDYNPNPAEYYLIFDIEQGEYGKTYVMSDFLYPGTSLEIRYDKETGNIVIPFGWTVLSYDTYLYITLVGTSKFSYASLEVDGVPSEDFSSIALELPAVDGFNYVGFGLWTYNDNGDKVALGSRYMPTLFPMGPIVFKKQTL